MIYIQKSGSNVWKVNDYTFNHPHMGIRRINLTIKHPSMYVDGNAPDIADFADCYVVYDGECYGIASIKPTGSKDNTTLDYTYELTFKGTEEELTRRKVRDLALVGVDSFVSQGTSFSIYTNLSQFQQLLQNNLTYYFGDEWTVNLSATSTDSVRIDVSNTTLFELLSKTYEYFGLRWKVEGKTITIGYEPEQIDHVFDYGKDGGLVKITRTGQDASIVNRLTGGGGTRNLPQNYFTDRYSDFAPDPNVVSDTVNIKNLMPKVFRDSVIAGNLPYIDYVEDEASIALNGVREDALQPNEDIYPSIAGVEVSGLGRIDEIIGSTIPVANKPDEENYSPTFDIWVKDIGFDLADEKYTSTQDAKISFTTGALAGYEFTILSKGKRTEGGTVKDKEVFTDTTKSHNGVNSAYRITLINSDEDFEATGRVMPNKVLYPKAGDAFVIYDIEMPHVYVKYAEERLQQWLEAQLEELKVEKPTYAIEPMDSFFAEPIVEYDGKTIQSKLKAGNKIYIQNSKLTDVKEELHINQLTIQYGGLLPKYVFTVTDKVQVSGSAVGRLQSQLDAVVSRQLLTEKEIDAILSGFSTKFLSKVKPDIAQQFMQFLQGVLVKGNTDIEGGLTVEKATRLLEDLEIGDYQKGLLGTGGSIDQHGHAELTSLTLREFLEVPELRYNKVQVYTGIRWDTFGAGIISEIEIDKDAEGNELPSGIITLKLEDGEFGAIDVNDMCQGIFHNFIGDNDGFNDDQRNGNFRFAGFRTSYFQITEILDGANKRFKYVLREPSGSWTQQNHPKPYMTFACYANPTNKDRQSSTYTTTDYTIRLKNMTGWTYGASNIYEISGKLDGFTIGGTVLEGEGQAFGNAYIWGTLQQIYQYPDELDNSHLLYSLEVLPEIISIPFDNQGNGDYTDATAQVKLFYKGEEIYPTLSADADRGNLLRNFDLRNGFDNWGGDGDYGYRGLELPPMLATGDGRFIVTENNELIWVSKK